MRPLTIVQLLPALESGGVERSTLEIAQALVQAGHTAVVVSAGGRLVPQLERAGARHVQLDIGRKSPMTLLRIGALARLLREVGADIVHARSRLPAWIGRLALARLPAATRPRWVTTVHGLNTPGRYSAVMASGERVICVSETVRAFVATHYPKVPQARLRVIPRGLDPASFPYRPWPDAAARSAVAARHPGLASDGPLLLLPGRGTRLKGHADAIQLLADLRGQEVPARLWMPGIVQPGREAYLAELQQQAQALGVAQAMVCSPATADMAQAYAASDLVLQLSRKPESFGRTVIEALSCGRHVVGWAHGGVGELLAELQPAGAVPAFDRAALLAATRQLLTAAAPAPGTMPFTLQAMQDATLSLYQELADERR
ncbi:glycosyltransferase [Pseudoxanthomonas composti]|uniref:Glycosyltransferase n=1 Tax=Pseudoxanthomonas composti TaxID=2137479 RepID=A0A4Q1JTA8_9GAMM|nr:glycosyltransferase [Pseudoxanthomonas composti]RXR04227.1 glycosyltransferase [Pseudoxanthomonas composti]